MIYIYFSADETKMYLFIKHGQTKPVFLNYKLISSLEGHNLFSFYFYKFFLLFFEAHKA